MYDVHLGLIGKRVVDFLLVIIELFSLDVTAEALRAKIDRTSAMALSDVVTYVRIVVVLTPGTGRFADAGP